MGLLWILLQQAPPGGPTGTDGATGTTTPLTPERVGPVREFLRGLGFPYPTTFGAIATFIVVAVGLYILGRMIAIPLVRRLLDAKGVGLHARRPLLRLARFGVVFFAVSIAFGAAGYGSILGSLATVGAAATLAIGFALQEVVQNFVAGVFIYTDRSFRIGDWIEWDDGAYSGVVEDISFRVTRVRTFDDELLTVPNSVLTNGVLKDPVAYNTLRISVAFGVSYDDDIEEATDLLVEEAESHPKILADPEPVVHMSPDDALADSSVGLTSRVWIKSPTRAEFLRVRGEYIRNVKARFNEAGIEIPFPQVDLSGSIAAA